jgi:hypothetical protein
MGKIWVIGITLFIVMTFLVWKFFYGFYKKEASKKMRKTWGARMYYWHFILMISGVATTLLILLLKWGNILNF